MTKRELAVRCLDMTGLRFLLGKLRQWSGVLCLNYHRIGDGSQSEFDRGLWSATEGDFAFQLNYLKSRFDLIGVNDLPDVLAKKSGRNVLITFDDGYIDNYVTAFPILKSHGVPATFFITTGFIDSGFLPWWDEIAWMVRKSPKAAIELPGYLSAAVKFDEPGRENAVRTVLRAFKSMPSDTTGGFLEAIGEVTRSGRYRTQNSPPLWMTWDMLREMHSAGMAIGGHTVSHPILANMTPEKQLQEIYECARRLKEELCTPMTSFSYPVGNLNAFDTHTRECLKTMSVQFAFSYYGGFRQFSDWDNYDIRRIAIESDTTRGSFRTTVTLPQMLAR